jgi:hypothetical protein
VTNGNRKDPRKHRFERFPPVNYDPLDERLCPEEPAEDRFTHYTRQATFCLKFGIREIRMLQQRPWHVCWAMTPTQLATVQKLIDKGILDHEYGHPPQITKVGTKTRELLVLSKHILPEFAGEPTVLECEHRLAELQQELAQTQAQLVAAKEREAQQQHD